MWIEHKIHLFTPIHASLKPNWFAIHCQYFRVENIFSVCFQFMPCLHEKGRARCFEPAALSLFYNNYIIVVLESNEIICASWCMRQCVGYFFLSSMKIIQANERIAIHTTNLSRFNSSTHLLEFCPGWVESTTNSRASKSWKTANYNLAIARHIIDRTA